MALLSTYWVIFLLPLLPVVGNMIECHIDGVELEHNAPYVESDGRISNIKCHKSCSYYVAYEINGVARENAVKSFTMGTSTQRSHQFEMDAPAHLWVSKSSPDYVSLSSPEEVAEKLQERFWSSIYFMYPLLVLFLAIMTYLFRGIANTLRIALKRKR